MIFTIDSASFLLRADNLKEKLKLEHASMGMSNDFAKAIQFGATYLRIGSAIFGNRS